MSDPARAYLTRALDLLEQHSIDATAVDWSDVRADAFRVARRARTTADTYAAINLAIDRLHDPHTFLLTPKESQTRLRSPQPPNGPPTGQVVPASTAGAKIAMLRLPAFSGTDAAAAIYARTGAAAVRDLDRAKPCGWIVDLREDGGGNMGPMLVTLAPLLTGEQVASFVDRTGTHLPVRLHDGGLSGTDIPPNPYRLNRPGSPVAILSGPRTASSGEITMIAFRGQPNTRTFGQPTAGFASGNAAFPLSDGATLIITAAKDVDRTGHVYANLTPIPPDESVVGPNAVVAAATKWLAATPACHQ
jgi:carboxyl-terminal processing protease